jgi:hypothetical protein
MAQIGQREEYIDPGGGLLKLMQARCNVHQGGADRVMALALRFAADRIECPAGLRDISHCSVAPPAEELDRC